MYHSQGFTKPLEVGRLRTAGILYFDLPISASTFSIIVLIRYFRRSRHEA